MGIYFDGGTIYIHDDDDATGGHSAGNPHTLDEIYNADVLGGWGVFLRLSTYPSYLCNAFIGMGDKVGGMIDPTGLADDPTSLVDVSGSGLQFPSGKTINYRGTQTDSWSTVYGVEVGAGAQGSGRSGPRIKLGSGSFMRGDIECYGSYLESLAGCIFSSLPGQKCVLKNCLIETGAGCSFTGGQATLYNVDFMGRPGAVYAVSGFQVLRAERLTAANSGLAVVFAGADLNVRQLAMFGSPSLSDLIVQFGAGLGGRNWRLVQPIYTGNANKFFPSGLSSDPDLAPQELWIFDPTVVNGQTGAPVAGVPVRLTDSTGDVQVNDLLTDSAGRVAFTKDGWDNAVTVADHYASGGVYTIRHRSPFLYEVNMPGMVGYDSTKRSIWYSFDWPGKASVTVNSGSFRDASPITPLLIPSGLGFEEWRAALA